jgi:signal peptidase I
VEDQPVRPRHFAGLFAIALFLGAPALMLWIGRFGLALIYTLVMFIVLLAALYTAGNDLLPLAVTANLGGEVFGQIIAYGTTALAFLHALWINRRAPLRPWYSKWYIALPAFHVVFLPLAFLARAYVFQPFNIPSASNIPNLMPGDYVMVSKRTHKTRDPMRGEIAVFKLPPDSTIDYIKRVVGLPGDRIQMKQGVLYINGTPVKLESIDFLPRYNVGADYAYFRETLPEGASYVIAEQPGLSVLDDTEEFIVPPGHYFVLGDNRDNSQDSRIQNYVGFIPRENFVGPYAFHFWRAGAEPSFY